MTAPPPNRGVVGDLIGRLFNYVDAPWKAFAVAGLLVIGVISWVVYEKRDELIEHWMTPSEVALKVAEVPAALDKLAEESGADLVQVWAVNLEANAQRFIGARRKDGQRPVIPEPRRLPIIVHTSDIKAIMEVIDGTPVCVDLTPQGTPFARRLAERGFVYGCAIPIPPGPSSFVGVIYLAWAERPDKSVEVVAVGAAREVAGRLIAR